MNKSLLDEARQKIVGVFDELSSKVFGKSLNQNSLDRLNTVALRFAATIEKISSFTALDRCKRLNDATRLGFSKVAEDIAEIKERLDDLEKSQK